MGMDRTVDEPQLMSRIIWRIMPILMLVYLVAVIDRSNIGFAKLQMAREMKMSEQAFGLASSLFFIGYLLFEIPSTLAIHRFGARAWLTRILMSWGAITVAMAFVTSDRTFTVMRFLLGIAEAGAYPGIIYVTSIWFPQGYRVRVMGIITLGSAFGNMFGALASGPLLDLHGLFGLSGWQWVFIITGAPAVLLGAVVLLWLPNRPGDAAFLDDTEKSWLAQRLGDESEAKRESHSLWQVLWDGRIWFLSAVYALILTSLYGVIYWTPTVIRAFGASGTQNGLLTSLPWLVTAVMLLILPKRLREHRSVIIAMVILSATGVAAFFLATVVPENWMRLLAMIVGTPCISLLLPCFWSLPSRFLTGERAAAGIGAISMLGSFGGFAAQNLMPLAAEIGGSAAAAMLVPAVCLALLGCGAASQLIAAQGKPAMRTAA
jgi:sugar phosphate permease